MALEKYEYPATGGVTNSFLPTRNPSYTDGPPESLDESIVSDDSAGGEVYNYAEGRPVNMLRRKYTRLASSEWDSYAAFRSAVKGDKFKFTDAAAAVHTVTFAEFARKPDRSAGNRATFEVVMREVL
jgi:hypothetical protein